MPSAALRRKCTLTRAAVAAMAGALTLALPAAGDEPARLAVGAEPAFGRHALPAEGEAEVLVTLAGREPATDLAPGCHGRIDPSRPDAVLRLDAGEPGVHVRVRADVDTTLVVSGPDGAILCDDDTFGVDPALTLGGAEAGDWAIWVGVYDGEGGEDAALSLGRVAAGSAPGLDRHAEPAAGVHVLGAEPLDIAVTLAGRAPAEEIEPHCTGLLEPARPDAVVRLEAKEPALHLWVRSSEDTTLFVLGPEGELRCNDDTFGLDPAVNYTPAPAGDYAVWVGVYSGAGGARARLEAGREAGEDDWLSGWEAGGEDEPFENPFAGRQVESAAAALAILLEDEDLAASLAYDRLEELGPDGFVLHGVRISDPEDPAAPPLDVARIRVEDLDLDGLAATGEPRHFRFALEEADYGALIEAGDLAGLPPLPRLDEAPTASFAMSFVPAADDPRRHDVALDLALDGQLGLRLAGRMRAPDAAAGAALEDAATESLEVEIRNHGFLGALLEMQAREAGIPAADYAAMMSGMVQMSLQPAGPGSPRARLAEVAARLLADPWSPGILRLSIASDEPRGIVELMEELEAGAGDGLVFEVGLEPLP